MDKKLIITVGIAVVLLAGTLFVSSSHTATRFGGTTNLDSLTLSGNMNGGGDFNRFGSVLCKGSLSGFGVGLELCGNQNSDSLAVQIESANNSTGTAAYSGFVANNDLADNTLTHFFGMFLNSSGYTSTTFGDALGIANLGIFQNTDGPLSIIASTSTSKGYINFLTNGTASTSERMRILPTGQVGIGTTTPITNLQVTATSSNATSTFEVGKVGQTKGSCEIRYTAGGSVAYVTYTTSAVVVSTNSCK